VLLALEHFFKPAHKLQEDDIFRHRPPEDKTAYVEIYFHELTEQDKNTFQKYLLSNEAIRIRKETTIGPDSLQAAYHGFISKAPYEWLDPDKAGDYKKPEDLPEELKPFLKDSGKLSKAKVEEGQQAYIQANKSRLTFEDSMETGLLMGQKNVAAGLLGEFFLLPAVRDYTDEAKIQEKTTFGQLITAAVREMSERNPEFQTIKDQLTSLMGALNKPQIGVARGRPSELVQLEENIQRELGQWSVSVDIEVTAPEIEKLFQLGTKVFVDDGVRTIAEMKGHGLQRAMVFAFLKAWTRTIKSLRQRELTGNGEAKPRASSQTYIFGIEEPELFLHPQAQRGMFEVLKALAVEAGHQVFICTHSGYFIDMDLYRSIVIINKTSPKEGSYFLQADKELFESKDRVESKRRFNMCYWFNPDRSELFFARKTVLVEGPTEKSILPMLAKRLGFWKPDVTVIDCGGKANIPLYMEVLNAFRIRYQIIHDEDPITLPETDPDYKQQKEMFKKNDEINNLINKLLGTVEILSPDFERVSGITEAQVKKCGKPMAAVNRFSVEAVEIPQRLKDVIEAMYKI
jgi:CRISPR-associated exonuclease Cas4